MAIHDGMPVVMCGMISGKRTLVTKNGRLMAFINLEDLYGITEIVVFPNVYEKCAHIIDDDKVVAISGKLNFKEDEAPKVLAEEVLDIDEAAEKGFAKKRSWQTPQSPADGRRVSKVDPQGRVKIRIPADMDAAGTLEEIKVNLKRHPGKCEVLIYMPSGKTLRTDQSMWVEPTESLRRQMAAIVGSENVKF